MVGLNFKSISVETKILLSFSKVCVCRLLAQRKLSAGKNQLSNVKSINNDVKYESPFVTVICFFFSCSPIKILESPPIRKCKFFHSA